MGERERGRGEREREGERYVKGITFLFRNMLMFPGEATRTQEVHYSSSVIFS